MIHKSADNLIRFWYDGKVVRKCDRKEALKLIHAGAFDEMDVVVWTPELEQFNLRSQRGAQYFGIKELNRR